MPPKIKDCNNVVTIKQFTGTCWFNALLMTLLYSDGMRKLLIKRSKYWKTSDKRLKNVYDMFKSLLKNNYTFTQKNKLEKFKIFDSIKPEHILETLNTIGEEFKFNPKVEEGYWPELYLPLLLRLFHIDIDNDIHIITCSGNMPVPGEKTVWNEKTYSIDSLLLTNFNIDICDRGHAIAGVTCKKDRYIYNGWLRPNDPTKYSVTEAGLPCELMKNDWINDTNDFCLSRGICKIDFDKKLDATKDLCFNFSKGPRTYIYIANDIDDKPGQIQPITIKNPKQYDPNCIRKFSNGENKYDALLEKINYLDKQDKQAVKQTNKHVIYTEFKATAREIKQYLESEGFKCAYNQSQKMQYANNRTQSKQTFGYLVSGTVGAGKPLQVATRKKLLSAFNARPDNVYGEDIRFMILDGAFKEGIDLFDVKYVHIIEPPASKADLKQVIGRATRLCGQRGLEFVKNVGWTLDIFVYDTTIPDIVKQRKGFVHNTMSEMAKSFAPSDDSVVNERVLDLIRKNSMDYKFNIELNNPGRKLTKAALNSKYTWGVVKPPINLCNTLKSLVTLSPSQLFIQNHLTGTSKNKGILAMHSVGTGKTITAINAALSSFKDYTVIWVTRSSLKTDMQKDLVKFNIDNGKIGDMPPLSYKQFANLLEGKNEYYNRLVRINGREDPLRKTFVIVDEAHKLIDDKDLKVNERVNLDKLKSLIHNSYKKSGNESCKMLLMTATPIVDSYHNFCDLIDLITEDPINKSDRKSMVVDKTKVGELRKLIKSTVSFLDRSGDATQFAQPRMNYINVPMTQRFTNYESMAQIKEKKKTLNKKTDKKAIEQLAMYETLVKVDKSQEKMLEDKCASDANAKTKPAKRAKRTNTRK